MMINCEKKTYKKKKKSRAISVIMRFQILEEILFYSSIIDLYKLLSF